MTLFLKTLICATYFQYIENFVIPLQKFHGLITSIDDFLIAGFICLMLLQKLITRKTTYLNGSKIYIILFFFFFIFTFSAIANKVPFINVFFSFKDILLEFSFLYALTICIIKRDKIKSLINFTLKIFVLQFIIQLFQLLIAVKMGVLNSDSLKGTFPRSNNLGYVYFFFIFYCLHIGVIYKQKKYIVYALIFIVGLLMSTAYFAVLMLPIVFIAYHRNYFLSKKYVVKFVLLSMFFICFFSITATSISRRENRLERLRYGDFYLFNPRYWVNFVSHSEFDVSQGSARMLWFSVTYNQLESKAFHPLIGMGPGMYTSFAAYRLMPSTNKAIYDIFHQRELGLDVFVDSQIIPLWGEFGYIGLFLIIFLFFYFIFRYLKIYYKTSDLQLKALSITSSAGAFFILIGMYINHFLETQVIMFTYVILLSFTEKLLTEELTLKSHENSPNK